MKNLKEKLLEDNNFREKYYYGDNSKYLLHEMRVAKGLSQIDLARKTGIKQASISRAEKNGCSLKFLNKIAKKLDLYLEIKIKKCNN